MDRYTCHDSLMDWDGPIHIKDPDGGWVLHSDHTAELTTLRQRLAEAEKELAGVLDLIPKDHIVRVREGGGPENVAATVAVSVGRVVHKFAEAAADAARWEGAARIMAKEIKVHRWSVDPGHHEETDEAIRITDQNPTASALVREGGGGTP